MLFFTGISRHASRIAKEQIQSIEQKHTDMGALARFAVLAEQVLLDPRGSLDEIGQLLHESWRVKRTVTAKITTPLIDDIYESARHAGALGGKLLGAGGGGFMLLFVRPEQQKKVRQRLRHLLYVPFRFERSGSDLIYQVPTSNA
jgi:D-glycero-alpha-D-manno-heptose-7-phosphate kinase